MTHCLHCAEAIDSRATVCPHCGLPQWPANRYNVAVSLPLVGLAGLVTLAYWTLSELFWIPLTQPLFYIVADGLGLNYIIGETASHTFFNGAWLLGGALLYLPLVVIGLMRFGFRRTVAAALVTPLPFAFMDNWAWSASERPGPLQFIPVLLIAAVLALIAHFTFQLIGLRWPARLALFEARRLRSAAGPSPRLARIGSTPAREPRPAPPIPAGAAAPTPDPAPLPEPAPPPDPAAAPPAFVRPPQPSNPAGLPVWAIIVGLLAVAVIGVVLIIFALNA